MENWRTAIDGGTDRSAGQTMFIVHVLSGLYEYVLVFYISGF